MPFGRIGRIRRRHTAIGAPSLNGQGGVAPLRPSRQNSDPSDMHKGEDNEALFVGMLSEIVRYIVSLMLGLVTVIRRIAGKEQPIEEIKVSAVPTNSMARLRYEKVVTAKGVVDLFNSHNTNNGVDLVDSNDGEDFRRDRQRVLGER